MWPSNMKSSYVKICLNFHFRVPVVLTNSTGDDTSQTGEMGMWKSLIERVYEEFKLYVLLHTREKTVLETSL